MRTLLMRVVSDKIADEYECAHDCIPTNPKKLVKELTKLKRSSKVVQNLPLTSENMVRPDLQVRVKTLKTSTTNLRAAERGCQPLFTGRPPRLPVILACSVACTTSTMERLSPTSHLIARGGQVPVRTTLNEEGLQPQLNNSTPMLTVMT